MVRLATIVISVLLVSACSNSEATPSAAAPESTPAATTTPVAATQPATSAPPVEAPAAAPQSNSALSFKAYGGRDIAIEDYKGKVVLVLFFSTDCPHCQTTARIMAPIYREYSAKGVEFLGLAVNPSAAQNLPAFVAQYGVEFPVGLGTSTQWYSFAKFSVLKKTPYVPHVLFVGKDGQVAEDHPGEDTAFWQDQATSIPASLDRLLAQ
ncbi:MAG: TlpA disulfide reductase family protein [Acidobacteria bacterium]|nr:TlpA disulfide reductase family protein [Acidobacteriota bacterium]MDA1234745.1 TlpA disulfide reductase family protein [Acidobacteriota bacterium]